MSLPRHESIILGVNTLVNLPVEAEEPLELHGVEVCDGNAADFGPGAVLEGVVV